MKPIIGIVSKNITIEEFYNWSWQRISNDVRYSINKIGIKYHPELLVDIDNKQTNKSIKY